jgi:hypothetical protein
MNCHVLRLSLVFSIINFSIPGKNRGLDTDPDPDAGSGLIKASTTLQATVHINIHLSLLTISSKCLK